MTNIYITYNPQLKDFLKNKGLKFIVCGLNPKPPHKTFWVFDRSEEFNKILDEWIAKR